MVPQGRIEADNASYPHIVPKLIFGKGPGTPQIIDVKEESLEEEGMGESPEL